MKPKTILRRMAVLVATLMCALGANAQEAYACYTSSNTTLTFYYDSQRSSRTGTKYDLNTGENEPGWYDDGTNASVTKVVFDPSFADARPTSTYCWFYSMDNLVSITGMKEYLNTSKVTNMAWMFAFSPKLISLDVSLFNTSKVTTMAGMFTDINVTSLDVSNFNTSNVTDMNNMFQECRYLKNLDLSNFNTTNVTDMSRMFISCQSLTSLDLSSFNTAKVTDMGYIFCGCKKLKSVDLSSFRTENLKDMMGMFKSCESLTILDLSRFKTSQSYILTIDMFKGCKQLQTIYVGSGWNLDNTTNSNTSEMFEGCESIVGEQGTTYDADHVDKEYAHIDGGTSNPGYLTSMAEAYACYTSSNKTLTFYYDKQRSSRTGTTYDLNTGYNRPDWFVDPTDGISPVTKVVFDPSFADARPTTTNEWFYYMQNLQTITGIEYLNTSEVTNMVYMFIDCNQLTSIDVSHFNTSQVTNMWAMFAGCSSLTSLDLSSFNTSQVTVMSYLFNRCNNLRTIYVGNGWSTAAVTNSIDMFKNCTSLAGGQGTTYNASNPTDMTYAHIDGGTSNPGYLTAATMPYACYTPENTTLTFYYDDQHYSRTGTTYALNMGDDRPDWYNDGTRTSVTEVVFDPSFASARPTTTYSWFSDMGTLYSIKGLAYLNTSAVTNMSRMFTNCAQLTSLDLTSFTTAKVTDMSHMFDGCWALKGIDLFSFNTAKVTDMSSMFYGCYYLTTIYVGTNWTTSAVTRSTNMFKYCYELVGGNGTVYDESHTDAAYALIDGYVGTGYLTVPIDHNKAPYACHNTSDMILTFYYDRMRGFHTETTYDLNTEDNRPGWYSWRTSVRKVVFDPSFSNASPECTYSWFGGMVNLQSIEGMSNLRTDWATNMAGMFNGCSKLSSIDLSNFRTPNATVMGSMFMDCSALTSLDLSTFNTAKVTNMFQMFRGCSNLQTIIVGKDWTTDAVTRSEDMFRDCTKLVGGKGTTYNENKRDKAYAHLDYGTSNPGYLTAMVEGYVCHTSSNTTLTFYYDNQRYYRTGTMYDLNKGYDNPDWINLGTVSRVVFDPSFADARPSTTSHWFADMRTIQSITGLNYLNTSNVNHMEYMFYDCTSLETLDLTSFNTAHVVNMEYMFYNCKKLKTIFVSDDWDTRRVAVSSYMFANSTSLVGGQGTAYNDSNPKDKTYAHIDYGSSNPGYFTYAAPGVVTHIEAVPYKATTVKGIYTLDGRKLNELPTQKGIYIIDGRRVVIK